MRTALCLCALLAAVAVAATPAKPVWPAAFSSTLIVVKNNDPQPRFTRWFYDSTLKMDRFDTVITWNAETYWASIINNHVTEQQTTLLFQMDDAMCFLGAINGTLPKPDFSRLQFVGVAIVNYEVCNHWIVREPEHQRVFQIYDGSDSGRIIRMDLDDDRRGESWLIYWSELDIDSQDPDLFAVPDELKGQCTTVH